MSPLEPDLLPKDHDLKGYSGESRISSSSLPPSQDSITNNNVIKARDGSSLAAWSVKVCHPVFPGVVHRRSFTKLLLRRESRRLVEITIPRYGTFDHHIMDLEVATH